MTSSLNESAVDRINQIIGEYATRLDELEEDLAIESAGVAQALAALRTALDRVDQCLKSRQYQEVANLGYRDVSSEFIFLQRTMGSLLRAAQQRSSVISEIAGDAQLAYEQREKLAEARRAQQRLEKSLIEIEKQRDDPQTPDSQRRRLQKLAENIKQAMDQSESQSSQRQTWLRVTQADQAEAVLQALAKGDTIPDQQWNKFAVPF
jgi:hypothetical protein